MRPRLTIMIPSTEDRAALFGRLVGELQKQIKLYDPSELSVRIQPFIDKKGEHTIGYKRNKILSTVDSDYCCAFDSDDFPMPYYINVIMDALGNNPDCLSLKGVITFDGNNPAIFEHSLNYSEWKTIESANFFNLDVKYERYPNHLNVIKSEIAKSFHFPETNFGEDKKYSDDIHASGLLKSENYIPHILYNYLYVTNKA